jgi:hypothetical protein
MSSEEYDAPLLNEDERANVVADQLKQRRERRYVMGSDRSLVLFITADAL